MFNHSGLNTVANWRDVFIASRRGELRLPGHALEWSLGTFTVDMATAPASFSRFLAGNLNVAIANFTCGRAGGVELLALRDRHRGPTQPSADHVRRQLVKLGFIERAAYAENAFEPRHPVHDHLLTALTRRHRLSSVSVLGGYFEELQRIEHDLGTAVNDINGIEVGERPHPRLYGTLARNLYRYVRERGALTLEQAVHKMTGPVRCGFVADMVLFDPDTSNELADYGHLRKLATGFHGLWVAGRRVLRDVRPRGDRPGRLSRHRSHTQEVSECP